MSRAILLIALLSPALAAEPARDLRPPATSRGAVFVYLQPFEGNAGHLRFGVDSLAAVSEGGGLPVRLALDLRAVDGAQVDRQRRLASGPVSPGRYTGLTLALSQASLGGDGRTDLALPSGPVEIPVPFQVENNGAVVLTLRLDFKASVREGFRFTPAFEARQAILPPVARLALASNPESASIGLYDRVSLEVVGFVTTGRDPSGLAIDPGRHRAYAAVAGDDVVAAIDLLEGRIVEYVRMQGGDEPTELALTPDGRTLLSANAGSRTVSFLDALSLVETDRITVGDRPRSVLLDPRGQRAYVFNTAGSSLSVVDVTRREVIGAIPTDSEPFRGHFNRGGDVLYVIHGRSPYLTLIDPASLGVTTRILLGTPATALEVDLRTDRVYVAPRGTGVIDVYDPLSLLPMDSLPADGDVSFLAIDGDDRRLHAAFSGRGEIWTYPLVGKKIATRLDLGAESYWISLIGER